MGYDATIDEFASESNGVPMKHAGRLIGNPPDIFCMFRFGIAMRGCQTTKSGDSASPLFVVFEA